MILLLFIVAVLQINFAGSQGGLFSSYQNLVELLRNNGWKFLYFNISLFIMVYFSGVFLIPYTRIAVKIRDLQNDKKNLTKKRKEIQKNYFKRKIDKGTFKELLTKNRDELYRVRSKLEDKKDKFEKLNRKVFYPNKFFPYLEDIRDFFGKDMKNLSRKDKNK